MASEEANVAGNSQGYIYSPHTLHFSGPSMEIKAGESLTIVPIQIMGLGPWKIFTSKLVNSELKTRTKNPKVFCIKITNKWLTKSIKIPRYTSLEALLASPGIEHIYTAITYEDLNAISDNNDEDDSDIDDNPSPPLSPCQCACCLKSH
jgi:hypothetical protein